jgi:hypothetical protein
VGDVIAITAKLLCLILATMVFVAGVGNAQSASAWLGVRPTRSFHVTPGKAFGLFGPITSLELSATVLNEAQDRELFLQPGFFQAITWSLNESVGGGGVTDVRWESTASCGFDPCSLDLPIRLRPGKTVEAIVELRFATAVPVGERRLSMDLTQAASLAREADGSAWTGGLLKQGSIDLDVRAVVIPRDLSAVHRVEALRGLMRKDYDEAARQFRLMASVEPTNPEAFGGLGDALLSLGRYAESVDALEHAVRLSGRLARSSILPRRLALAYVAAGRPGDGERILRGYYSDADVALLLAQIRDEAKRLQDRRPIERR